MTRPNLTLSPTQAGIDMLGTIAVAIMIHALLHRISPAYAGPATATAVLITTSSCLRLRGQSWIELGLALKHRVLGMTGLVVVVMVGTILIGALTASLCNELFDPGDVAQRTARFGEVEGRLGKFLMLVAMGWIVGGFAEEMVFRGFFLHRIETLIANHAGPRWLVTTLAVIGQAALFGGVHYYNRGWAGALTITAVGITLGCFFLFARRSLWPTILAHGIIDSLGFLEDYLGA